MHDKLRGGACNSFAVRHRVKRPFQLGMLLDIVADLPKTLARRLETLLEFRLGLDLGFAQRHLHPAVRVDLAFTRRFDGQKDHVLEFIDHRGLHAVGLR
jgi:hypothetical protein